jgi:hypothetical protein
MLFRRHDRWRSLHTLVYMRMHTHAQDVVERYYAAFDAHRNEWQDLVTDDVVFEGPLQHARGKAEFVDLTAQFLSAHRATRLLGRSPMEASSRRYSSSSSTRQTASN